MNQEQRLGTEPIGKLMVSMGTPTLIAQIINLLYNIVDRMYIGHLVGAQALTGVGLTLPILMIISAFSCFAGVGGAPLAAIALGEGKREEAEKILGNAVFLLLCFSASLMVIFYTVKKPFLYFIGASDTTWPYARDYLVIYLLGTVAVQLVIGLNTFITAQGRSRIAMGSVLIGAGMNLVLDPVFIVCFHMGVRGAALATVLSQFTGTVWVLHFLTSEKATLRLRRTALRPEAGILKKIAALGISPFIMQSTESLISMVMSSGLKQYGGDVYVGSLTILQSVMQLISIPISGFTQGVQPIISYNFGAGNMDRVRETYRKVLMITTGASFLLALTAIVFPGFYAGIFTDDAELVAVVRRVLPIFICGMLIFGLQMGCQNTFLGLGQAKISLFIALLRKVFLLIPFALIFPRVTGSVIGIYYAECTADILAATTCGILFLRNIKRILREREERLKTELH